MSAVVGTAAAVVKAAAIAEALNATISTLVNLKLAADQVSAVIKQAQAENREVTDDELNAVVLTDDAAKALLDADIAARQASESKPAV